MNDDAELLSRIRNGAPEDFAEIVRRYSSHVVGILYRYERDPHKLEDLTQETFLKVWRGLDQFDARAPFAHWLSRVTTRVALDHLRAQKRHQREMALEDLGEDVLEWLRCEDSDKELAGREAGELLAAGLRELSPAEQVVITLQELEGLSVKEICARTGSSSVAVRVRALRARAKLRRALERLEAAAHNPKNTP